MSRFIIPGHPQTGYCQPKTFLAASQGPWGNAIVILRPILRILIGNPCPVVDQQTGTIWLAMTRTNGRVLSVNTVR